MSDRYLADTDTILTGESSLRNYVYEPSCDGSDDNDEDSDIHSGDDDGNNNKDDDGESILSSVRSSIKRGLQEQRSKGFDSAQSMSTRQSDNIMWQDSSTEVDVVYDSDEADTYQSPYEPRDAVEKKNYRRTKPEMKSILKDIKLSPIQSSDKTISTATSGEGNSPSSFLVAESGDESIASSSLFQQTTALLSKRDSNNKPSKSSTKGEKKQYTEERVHRTMQSRKTKTRDKHRSGDRKKTKGQEKTLKDVPKLNNVDYISQIDSASTNRDLSTIQSLDSEGCRDVFKGRIPSKIPTKQSEEDDMSTLYALSTKVPKEEKESDEKKERQAQQEQHHQIEGIVKKQSVATTSIAYHAEEYTEEQAKEDVSGSMAFTKTDNKNDRDVEAATEVLQVAATNEKDRRTLLQAMLADHSQTEIFLTTLASLSCLTLIILIIILITM